MKLYILKKTLTVKIIRPWRVFLLTLVLSRTSLSFLQKKIHDKIINRSRSHPTFTAKEFAIVSYYIFKAKSGSFNIKVKNLKQLINNQKSWLLCLS